MPHFIRIPILICMYVVCTQIAQAQVALSPESVPEDSVVISLLPVAAYDSDYGLIGALAGNRLRYHPRATPYLSLSEIRLKASTKGLVDFRISYERTENFGFPVRFRWNLYGARQPFDNYFGVGNQVNFDPDAWEDNFYYYDVRRGGVEWMGRNTVFKSDNRRGRLDYFVTAAIGYEVPNDNDENLMGEDRPVGINGGWVNSMGTGVLWENRDSEFEATRGNWFKLSGEWSPSFFFSDYPMGLISSEYRQFVTLPVPYFRPVLATRMVGKWATGQIPYWKRPYLGDEMTLRGYPLYRFRGDASLLYNLELRTWIYKYPYYKLRLGIHGFHDAGRVFYNGEGINELFRDYHRTIGGGVAGSVFTPDFIMRIDIGFSDEMYRLYMNVGYMF